MAGTRVGKKAASLVYKSVAWWDASKAVTKAEHLGVLSVAMKAER